MDSLKFGKYVGRDRYGNKYYENPRYFFPTNRWVVYAEHHGLNYDASQVNKKIINNIKNNTLL